MEQFIPDMYQQSIYTIDFKKIMNKGIKCILFDLDNTLVPIDVKSPDEKLMKFFSELKKKKLKLIIFSNSPKKRVKPFADALGIDYLSSARKPCKRNILYLSEKFNYGINEMAIIGDQMLTDIVAGNKAGIMTVLTTPLTNKDFIYTKPNRFLEKRIMKRLRDKNLFSKERYYEL